ncbi:MAG: amino acid ABC transporter substrate-binding protein [Betaproteobacteria bacterium]|nr:amino acid ABC transporter substrate-binding protein [Betaproteobacteria bacterium]
MLAGRRKALKAATTIALGASVPSLTLFAQQRPVKIGMSIAQTGPLASAGKPALLALQMWIDEVNARGGLLGRSVELIVYDDQGAAAATPGIYTKLLDVDRVDLLIAPYGTVPTAPLMGMVKSRAKLLMGNFSFRVNHVMNHDMWFNNAPWNDARSFSEGFFRIGQKQGANTVAFLAADNEFGQSLANGAREFAKELRLQFVYDQNYPPGTTDFSSMVRAIRAARPDMVYVMSYPAESVLIVRAVREIGVGSSVKIFGGGMVGLQYTSIMESLGSALNGIVNYNTYVPGAGYPGIEDFLSRYSKRAADAKVDPLGFYLPAFAYAIGQMLEQAITATGIVQDRAIADYLRRNELQTVVGPVRYGPDGEWARSRVLTTQFQGVKDKDLEQFRMPGVQAILFPDDLMNRQLKAPFEQVRAST